MKTAKLSQAFSQAEFDKYKPGMEKVINEVSEKYKIYLYIRTQEIDPRDNRFWVHIHIVPYKQKAVEDLAHMLVSTVFREGSLFQVDVFKDVEGTSKHLYGWIYDIPFATCNRKIKIIPIEKIPKLTEEESEWIKAKAFNVAFILLYDDNTKLKSTDFRERDGFLYYRRQLLRKNQVVYDFIAVSKDTLNYMINKWSENNKRGGHVDE